MKLGILLTNTGTPDEPTPQAVKRYLREFLSDKRIVQLPRLIWLPILYGIILNIRPKRSAALYQKIWTNEGSPLRVYMQKLLASVQTNLCGKLSSEIVVEIGMNYGSPSIQQGLENLQHANVDKMIVLPLYPQYSATTTASTLDRITQTLTNRSVEKFSMIEHYADNQEYIRALAQTIRQTWSKEGEAEHLLMSFHGIPKRYIKNGDPYYAHCQQTANLLAQEMQLTQEKWTLCFQSKFGYDKWLSPSTQELFSSLPTRGIKNVDVICPGFSVDCLETLEEIAITGKESFFQAGGQSLRYIPALNDTQEHIDLLSNLIINHLS